MTSLERIVKKRLEEMKTEMEQFARKELQKELGIQAHSRNYRFQPLLDYSDIIVRRQQDDGKRRQMIYAAPSPKEVLALIDRGIWPKYLLTGAYVDGRATHSDYINTGFRMFVSTNYSLADYCEPTPSIEGQRANLASIHFLRNEGITGELWERIKERDEDICDFCLRPARPGERERIIRISSRYSKKKGEKVKYTSTFTQSNNFCNEWV